MDMWSYDRDKHLDKKGKRWHFVHHHFFDKNIPYDELPDEWYFRDDARTVFGLLRFGRRKDNPFRNYETMVNKIMNDEAFRETLLAPATKKVWSKNWK
ncbi:MAG TPA: hypothetical protein VKB86_22030 [Pyrinomonadaceae bacterium]|nr:hypothetical protein [Pyrinomonadaceae bacterium]